MHLVGARGRLDGPSPFLRSGTAPLGRGAPAGSQAALVAATMCVAQKRATLPLQPSQPVIADAAEIFLADELIQALRWGGSESVCGADQGVDSAQNRCIGRVRGKPLAAALDRDGLPHAAAFIPLRLLRFGLGTRCPGHSRSSYSSGLLASPRRMAGVLPSFSLT